VTTKSAYDARFVMLISGGSQPNVLANNKPNKLTERIEIIIVNPIISAGSSLLDQYGIAKTLPSEKGY
jgi:hypothetical protein